MIPNKIQAIAAAIGEFYLNKNNGDYKATENELVNLRIETIEILSSTDIMIKLARPGLLIGRKGLNIDALSKHLSKKIFIVESSSQLIDYLVPFNFADL